ncbi:Arc family DNA binding domain-containing protein [Gemmatimonas groenlandica]|uniref:Arc family DNA binding domain-containing protein n=1 Tax=Gemmatimonas groenlandica TaxID=2732249 RepID=A0A6M4IQU8_9BACT|nr:Arc family DNA binding domain-containing protein [Gemmatimonas groenlandica]QJR37103.1 Arc family DNA binding domain-containing protein [Gemmatimonas groenlandica]
MAERKSFLIRVDRDVLDAVQRWANDDLRSLNGQIEFLLRRALRDAGRVSKQAPADRNTPVDDIDHESS